MDISDPVVVEGMQNMQIHQSGKQLLQISKKIFEIHTKVTRAIGEMPKLYYVSGITQIDCVERWNVNNWKYF